MKRLPRLLLKTAIFLLLLPLMIVYGLFIYGKYMTYAGQQRQEMIDEQQAVAASSGNGYGGDAGMKVIDSRHRSENYFWIDNDHLVFQTNRQASEPADTQKHFVWDTRVNAIKPLIMEGVISSVYDGKLLYAKSSAVQDLPDGKKKVERFQSTLRELDDRWVLQNTENVAAVLGEPPERYELAWKVDGKPWFRLKSKLRTETDVPKHRFVYLWEWGWIFRTPWVGPDHFYQEVPQMGFFDLGGEIYADQPGRKIAGLVDITPADLPKLEVRYIGFLDKYWLANRLYGNSQKLKFMGFLDRKGLVQPVEWPSRWAEYSDIPLPTRKGLFWSGLDYRLESPGYYDRGAFLRDREGLIRKAVQGSALGGQMTNDGCRVAFFNPPRPDRGAASLKLLNICQSTMDGKELTNVDY